MNVDSLERLVVANDCLIFYFLFHPTSGHLQVLIFYSF